MARLCAASQVVLLIAGCSSPGDRVILSDRYLTGVHPNDMAVGDFDGDGDLDVAVPGLVSPQLATLWASADGIDYSFETPIDEGAANAASADVDGDGRDELLLSNREWPAIQVLGYDGDSWAQEDGIDIASAEQLRAADLDGDGQLDLVITRFREHDVVVLASRGAPRGSRWSPPRSIPTGGNPMPLAIVDAGAALPVVAVGETYSDQLSLQGFGGDASDPGDWQELSRVDIPAWPAALTQADDGRVVGTANLGDSLFFFDPRDTTPLDLAVTPAGAGTFGAAWYARDTRLAVTNKTENTLVVYDVTGATPAELLTLDTEPGPSPVAAVDLDGDAREELVVVDAFADSVSVYRAR